MVVDAKADGVAALGAALAFAFTTAGSQALQSALGMHTGSKLFGVRAAPGLLGLVTVAVGSNAALAACDALRGAGPPRHPRPGHPRPRDIGAVALLGSACFVALGGRFWALSPSSLSTLGAFSNTARASLPATLAYATSAERAAIQKLGRKFGCHTCGTRFLFSSLGRYNADHMPPLSEVRRANSALWRRALSRPVTQRFYPQCTSCSSLQASLLSERSSLISKLGSEALAQRARTQMEAVRHWPSPLRPYFGVGAVLALQELIAEHGGPDVLRAAQAVVDEAKWFAATLRRAHHANTDHRAHGRAAGEREGA
jgi:hypothetical protein